MFDFRHSTRPALVALIVISALSVPIGVPAQADPGITFDHYHTLVEIGTYLEAMAERHDDLTTLLEIGRSREDRPIWALEINNPTTGPAEEKPGFYVDGNIHGGEVLGGEGALAFINRLLTTYDSDPRVAELVNTRAFYIVPIVNPDGRAISVDTPENHRWNVRPTDEDQDGRVDEDPPEDLDQDGRILQMRILDPEGGWMVHADDSRRMKQRPPEESGGAPYYRLMTEGIDNDGDGRFNEDRLGGVDLNRNFPANWSAAQFASGPFPLSEPETWALVQYITSRPNIAAVHTFHTSGGLLLRFPTLADQDWDFPEADLLDYRAIAEDGVALTGYANFAYEKKTIVDIMSPGHGVFNDWASKEFGVLAMTTEMWGHALGEGQTGLFDWNDDVLDGKGFIDWYDFDHPQLGKVQLGGWDRWSIASPPDHLIADELARNVDWVLTFADKTPRVALLDAATRRVDERTARLEVQVANTGWMATATVHATDVLGTARPVTVRLELENAGLVEGDFVTPLGVLPGTHGGDPELQSLSWTLRISDPGRIARVTVTVHSAKAGVERRTLEIEAPRQP